MSESASRDRRLSVDEYLRREARAQVRHEYVAGHVYAMTGATARHIKITLNVATHLRAVAGNGPCQVFVNDMKVRVDDDTVYYPDVVVACGAVDDDDAVYVSDPCLVVEVTSPGTRATDRREKLLGYGRLASLQAYLIVDHRRRRVEWYVPGARGLQLHAAVSGAGGIDVPCPRTALPLDAIYASVTLPAVGERAARYRARGPVP